MQKAVRWFWVIGCVWWLGACSAKGPSAPIPEVPPAPLETWENSGGDGVACFSDEAAAREGDRRKIKTLVALDFWDFDLQNYGELRADYQAYLRDVAIFLKKHSPLFHSFYKPIAEEVYVVRWRDRRDFTSLPVDAPKRALPSNCRIIPIVAPRVQLAAETSEGVEVEYDYDRELFETKLDPLNQAMVVLHQIFHRMGKQIASSSLPRTADSLRRLVSYLLWEDEREALQRIPTPSLRAKRVQAALVEYFGDYYESLADQIVVPEPPLVPNGQFTRFLSFRFLLKRIQDRLRKCDGDAKTSVARGERRKNSLRDCYHNAIYGSDLAQHLTPEQAFLYLGRWVADGYGALLNSENLVAWDASPDIGELYLQSTELRRLCQFVRTVNPSAGQFELFAKADHYCFVTRQIPLSFTSLRCRSNNLILREINVTHAGNGLYSLLTAEENSDRLVTQLHRDSLFCQRRDGGQYDVKCFGQSFAFHLVNVEATGNQLALARNLLLASWNDGNFQWSFLPSERTISPGNYCEIRD